VTFEPLTPERRRAITRQTLIDAAAMVFARDGFHSASLDEVAKTAGFTKGAVYSNFKSKEDLFLAVLDDRVERQFVIITEALDTSSHDREEQLPRLAGAIHSQMWDDNWSMLFLEFVLYASRNDKARTKLVAFQRKSRTLIADLIDAEYAASGPPPPAYPTSFLAILSMAIFNGFGVEHLIEPEAVSEEVLEQLLHFMYDAMGSDDPDAVTPRPSGPSSSSTAPTPPTPPRPPIAPTPPTPPASGRRQSRARSS
jgi:AcrR family transcriptional regulator